MSRGYADILLWAWLWLPVGPVLADLADTLEGVKPGIVAVGTLQATRQPPAVLLGTGFVVADGRHVITNAHVLPARLDSEHQESLAVFTGSGAQGAARQATRILVDEVHDLALLRIGGDPLPALRLAPGDGVREGQEIAFTGFPIGMVLGLYPVTHRGIVAAISPVVLPAHHSGQLDAAQIRRLRTRFDVYQLDATAYPGNSGSPLFDPRSGEVLGIVNLVFVKAGKENILKDPSGIAYAIPVRHARELLRKGLGEP
ncbi:MAG: serine protease [Gammaproteobacteria bacterium]|nr:serine protease [Gammaproteobacteria bacterium]